MNRSGFLRFITVIFLGFSAGWLLGRWGFPDSRPPLPTPSPGKTTASANPSTTWEQWLEQNAPLDSPADAEAFWSMASGLSGQPLHRQRLLLDEACLAMPWASFVEVVKDGRFVLFTAFGSDDGKTEPWCRRLTHDGLDQALKLSGKLASRWLNSKLDHALSRFLAETDPDKGFRWLKGRQDAGSAIAQFLNEVTSRDLPKVTRLWHQLEAQKPADGRERTLAEAKNGFAAGRILHALSAKDWKTALTWADKNLTGSMREKNISDIFQHIGRKGADEVLATAGEISDPAVRSIALSRALANRYSTSDELMVKALDLPASSLDAKGWEHLGQESARHELRKKDAGASAGKLRTFASLVPEESRAGYLQSAALMGLWNDPALAGQLSEFLNEESTRSLAEKWAEKDPTAASTWLTQMPESEKRQAAIAGFCRGLAPVDPPAAAEWALSLRNESTRTTVLHDALGAWQQTDPRAATAWALEKGVKTNPP